MKINFISYINRSGSSFLSQKLSEYQEVLVFPEGDALIDKFLLNDKVTNENAPERIQQILLNDKKLESWNFSNKDINHILNQPNKPLIFKEVLSVFHKKEKPLAKYFFFKKRDAFVKWDNIKKILSGFSIQLICLYRDPRAIFFSQKNSIDPYRKKHFNTNPLVISYYWLFFLAHKNCQISSASLFYEKDICSYNFNVTYLFKRLKIFLVSAVNDKSVTYFDILPKEQQKLHQQIVRPANQTYIDKWRKGLKKHEIKIIEDICAEKMKELGYTPLKPKVNKFLLIGLKLYYKLRIFFLIDKY